MMQVNCGDRAYQVPAAVAKELLALRRLEQDVRATGLVNADEFDEIHRQVLQLSLLLIDRARDTA